MLHEKIARLVHIYHEAVDLALLGKRDEAIEHRGVLRVRHREIDSLDTVRRGHIA